MKTDYRLASGRCSRQNAAARGCGNPRCPLMPAKPTFDAEHWRSRAEEARMLAELMGDPAAKGTMLEIADQYERLAQQAEKRAELEKRPPAPSIKRAPAAKKTRNGNDR
jgi:hypothetical protein